jgi:putative two-component system response regulator
MDLCTSRIMVVDDELANVRLMKTMLHQFGFTQVCGTCDPFEAVAIYREVPQDLVLLDLRMPGLSGLEVLLQLQQMELDSYAPVLIMTAQTDPETRRKVLQAGAKDFVTKPFDVVEVLSRINNLLEVRQLYKHLQAQTHSLEDTVRARTRELSESRLEVVRRLGRAAEYRDNETGLHVMRMSKTSAVLARQCGWSPHQCDLMLNASPMHDIGKIGVPDAILLKPGKLNAQEWDTMRTHPVIGAEILSGHDSELMNMAHDIALNHHEKWDGSGYPNGRSGQNIPEVARIVAVADVFDALTSARPYKPAWSVQMALHEIDHIAGHHLEPAVVAALHQVMPEVLDIRERYSEPEEMSHLQRLISPASFLCDT